MSVDVNEKFTKRHRYRFGGRRGGTLLWPRRDAHGRLVTVANAQWTRATTKSSTKTLYGFTPKYALHTPSEHTSHHHFLFSHQLTGHANGLSSIYERISYTIRELQDDKAALQGRIEELEQGNPSDEVRRLRDENAVLHARLATTTKEKSEVTWERDALLRKVNSIKQLIDGPAVRPFPFPFVPPPMTWVPTHLVRRHRHQPWSTKGQTRPSKRQQHRTPSPVRPARPLAQHVPRPPIWPHH